MKFQNPINGERIFLSPEKSMEIQYDLGSDIVMIFDECTPYPATFDYAKNPWKCLFVGQNAAAIALMN